ncbi:MAG: hypothetical protein ACRDQ2_12290 [Gaiellales bacterium]
MLEEVEEGFLERLLGEHFPAIPFPSLFEVHDGRVEFFAVRNQIGAEPRVEKILLGNASRHEVEEGDCRLRFRSVEKARHSHDDHRDARLLILGHG